MIFDVSDNAKMNLGKEIVVKSGRKAMIVGYSIFLESLIVSYTADVGFKKLTGSDTILLRSPLNVSYGYASLKYAKNHIL